MTFRTVNPADEEVIRRFDALTDDELDERLARASRAFESYRETELEERSRWLLAAADRLESGAEAHGRLMTIEMGKPIGQAVAEVRKCARVCRYYAERGADFLAGQVVETDARRSEVRYRPLGPVLAVMPWNFPFWQVFRFAAPALMAGNVALLKHAPNVPQCALALEGVFNRAGFPEDVFQNLFATERQVADLLGDPRLRAATLTGSVGAGSAVASIAGREIKKTVLELGGSDPFVVLADADLDAALETAVRARTQNSGQSCIAAKRFVVAEEIADAFTEGLTERFEALVVGDPLDPDTDVGPLARADLRERLASQVDDTAAAGARVLTGGSVPEGRGWYYPPTVLTGAPAGSPAADEELFGPVATVFRAEDPAAALEIANRTRFGLGASVWTRDEAEQNRFAAELEVGTVAINGMVASDPRVPFGGVKDSGYGRELGPHGIREFMNVQVVHWSP
ncbi:MAG: NAD-dependent succinate-semialdehyde dehydrogenase [Gemmatimonadota bacterium]